MEKNPVSYLTDLPAIVQNDVQRNVAFYEDPVCGAYGIGSFVKDRLDRNVWEKRRIASVLAQQRVRGVKQPIMIVNQRVESIPEDMTRWSYYSIDELLQLWPKTPVELLGESLLNLSYRVPHPAEPVRLAPTDCWLVYSHDVTSETYVVEQLCDLGYLKFLTADPDTSYATRLYAIQAKGWEKLVAMRSDEKSSRRQAFVAMWFAPEMAEVFEKGIRPAVEHDGTKCVRIDLKEHNNKICDEIIAEIRRSRYVVADFTGNRGGVYYEAGFAAGLSLPVIWTVREDFLPKVHFDTRQYNHIVYASHDDLRPKLLNRIRATVA